MSKLPGNIVGNGVTTFQDMWVLNDQQLAELSAFISKKEFLSWFLQIFESAAEAITSVNAYPFDIEGLTDGSTTIVLNGVPVKKYDEVAELQAPHMLYSTATPVRFELTCDSNIEHIPAPEDISFIDYEPFTTYKLYIPFIGVVDLNARNILGKKITLDYTVDFHTGGCTVYLYNDRELLYTTSFQMGVSVPFGSTNEGDAVAARALGSIKTGLTLGFGGMTTPGHTTTTTHSPISKTTSSTRTKTTPRFSQVTGRPLKSATTISTSMSETNIGEQKSYTEYPAKKGRPDPMTAVNGILDMADTKTSFIAGAPGGDFSQFATAITPYLIITKTHIHDVEDYGHYFGYACAEKIRLGDHHGYCEISNIHIEGMEGVTAEELDVIEDYLKTGVILP